MVKMTDFQTEVYVSSFLKAVLKVELGIFIGRVVYNGLKGCPLNSANSIRDRNMYDELNWNICPKIDSFNQSNLPLKINQINHELKVSLNMLWRCSRKKDVTDYMCKKSVNIALYSSCIKPDMLHLIIYMKITFTDRQFHNKSPEQNYVHTVLLLSIILLWQVPIWPPGWWVGNTITPFPVLLLLTLFFSLTLTILRLRFINILSIAL